MEPKLKSNVVCTSPAYPVISRKRSGQQLEPRSTCELDVVAEPSKTLAGIAEVCVCVPTRPAREVNATDNK